MKKYVRPALVAVFFLVVLFSVSAQAQVGGDIAFGLSTVSATPSDKAGTDFSPQSIGGGIFPSFSGDVRILKVISIGGNVSWRATRNLYRGTVPFRPIFYDVDAFWQPLSVPKVRPQIWAGIGAVSNRFYTGQINCSVFSCTNFQSVTHFLGDFGGGIKFHAKGGFFIRPEATIYLIHNNTEFSGPWAARFGASIGYGF